MKTKLVLLLLLGITVCFLISSCGTDDIEHVSRDTERAVNISGTWEINLNYQAGYTGEVKNAIFRITIMETVVLGDWGEFIWNSHEGNIPNSDFNNGFGLIYGSTSYACIHFWSENDQGEHIDQFSLLNCSKTPETKWKNGYYFKYANDIHYSGDFTGLKQ